MLLFGGNNFDAVNELFAFNLRRREWSKLKASGDVPSKRYGHQAVVTNDARMIVFGGYNGTFLADVHELTQEEDGKWRWRRVETSGTAKPCARDGHAAFVARDGRTLVVYGGFDGHDQLDDLFALDTSTYEWRELTLDQAKGGVVGGSDDDNGAEEQLVEERDAGSTAEARPAARYMHSAVPCGADVFVYGGYLAGGEFADDLWRLTLSGEAAGEDVAPTHARWRRVRPKGRPPGGSFGHASAADSSGRLWLSGGFGEGSFSNALHVFDPSSRRWSRVDARGARPSPRHKHTMVATPDDELLVFGGNDFGPTRGFFSLDVTRVDPAQGGAGSAVGMASPFGGASTRAPLSQLIALLLLTMAAWLCQEGAITGAACVSTVIMSAMTFFTAEMAYPPPGGLGARMRRTPQGGARRFERSLMSVATDLAAAAAAASLASLLTSSGLGSLKAMLVK